MIKIQETKRKVITLCGSTRFQKEHGDQYIRLVMGGWTVLTCPALFQCEGENKGLPEISSKIKERLDECHKEKILMSDAIFVINPGGYIGDSTRSEISFALAHYKDVIYQEPNVKHECTKCKLFHNKKCDGTDWFKTNEHYNCVTEWRRFKAFDSGTRFMDV